jgi:chromosome segregation ATPase
VNKISAIALVCLSLPLSESVLSSNVNGGDYQQIWPHQQEIEQLRVSVVTISSYLSDAHQKLAELENDKVSLTGTLHHRQKNVDEMIAEVNRLYSIINAKDLTITEVISREATQVEQLRVAQENLTALQGRLAETQLQKATAEAQIEIATRVHSEQLALHDQQSAQVYTAQIAELRAISVQRDATITGLNTEVARLNALVEMNRLQVDVARRSQLDLEVRLSSAIEQIRQGDEAHGQAIIQQLQVSTDQLANVKADAASQLARAVDDLEKARAEVRRVEESQSILHKEIETSQAKICELQYQLEQERVGHMEIVAKYLLIIKEKDEQVLQGQHKFETEVDSLHARVEDLLTQRKQRETEHQADIESESSKADILRASELVLKARIQELLAAIEMLHEENLSRISTLEALFIEERATFARNISELQAVVNHKDERAAPIQSQLEGTVEQLNAKVAELLAQLDTQRLEHESKFGTVSSGFNDVRARQNLLATTIETLRHENQQLTAELKRVHVQEQHRAQRARAGSRKKHVNVDQENSGHRTPVAKHGDSRSRKPEPAAVMRFSGKPLGEISNQGSNQVDQVAPSKPAPKADTRKVLNALNLYNENSVSSKQ